MSASVRLSPAFGIRQQVSVYPSVCGLTKYQVQGILARTGEDMQNQLGVGVRWLGLPTDAVNGLPPKSSPLTPTPFFVPRNTAMLSLGVDDETDGEANRLERTDRGNQRITEAGTLRNSIEAEIDQRIAQAAENIAWM